MGVVSEYLQRGFLPPQQQQQWQHTVIVAMGRPVILHALSLSLFHSPAAEYTILIDLFHPWPPLLPLSKLLPGAAPHSKFAFTNFMLIIRCPIDISLSVLLGSIIPFLGCESWYYALGGFPES